MLMAVRAMKMRSYEWRAPQNFLLKSTGVRKACGSIVGHRSLGAAGIKLQEVEPKNQEFRDYGKNPIHLLGTMRVELVST